MTHEEFLQMLNKLWVSERKRSDYYFKHKNDIVCSLEVAKELEKQFPEYFDFSTKQKNNERKRK